MAKYAVYGAVTATKYIGTVEAETEEEAIKLGWKHDNCYVSVCHQCADHVEDPDIQSLIVERE